MTMSTQLPAHSLSQPLSTDDEHLMRQVIANAAQIAQIIDHAKAMGLDTSQHEARTQMHTQFASTCLERFFPLSMSPQVYPDDPNG